MSPDDTETEEFITIIAPTTEEAMGQFKSRGLDRQGYAIAGRIGRHRFTLIDGHDASDPFAGRDLIAATFSRRVPFAHSRLVNTTNG